MAVAKVKHDPKINSRLWVIIILAMWVSLIIASYSKPTPSTSEWLNVASVTVTDTEVGTCPIIRVAKHVIKPFYGEWMVTLLKQTDDGSWTALGQSYTGYGSYSDTYFEPTGAHICLRAMPKEFFSTAGVYKLHISWVVLPMSGKTIEIATQSNTFSVTPPN